MRLTSDIILHHQDWERADTELRNEQSGMFNRLVDIFVLACAIGVREDKTLEPTAEETLEQAKSIGRNTYQSLSNTDLYDILDFLLQNAILNSKTIDLDMDERLKLAFDPDYNNKKINANGFLVGFANYGLKMMLANADSKAPTVAINNLHDYLDSLTESSYDEILKNFTVEDFQ